jgi:hypothetical protein
VQLLKTFDALLGAQRAGGFRSYAELVSRDLLPP